MNTTSDSGYKAPRWAWWTATGLGSGWLRPASGTWGSAAALLAWMLLTALLLAPFTTWVQAHHYYPHLRAYQLGMELLLIALIVSLTWISVKASDLVVKETGAKDPGYIVADEWAGMWIAVWPLRWILAANLHRLFVPGWWRVALLLALPFVLFRIFDVWKPWPAHQVQDLPAGQGVVADDVVAGLYALVITELLRPFLMAKLGM